MVDFESWILDRIINRRSNLEIGDIDSDSDSDGNDEDSSNESGRRPTRKKIGFRERREIGKSCGCECEDCIDRDETKRRISYRDYDDVDPKGHPPNEKHFFLLCNRDVLAFALKERAFGDYCPKHTH